MLRKRAVLALVAALAACGSGGDGGTTPGGLTVPKSECASQFVARGSTVQASCNVACGDTESLAAANDGDRGSFSTMYGSLSDTGGSAGMPTVYSVPGSMLDIKVTAPSGVSFPAGTKAGAIAQLGGDATTQHLVTVTTYLGGTLQETFDGGAHSGSAMDLLFSYPTTKAYDAVQFGVNLSSPGSTERPKVKVYEFCG